MPKTRLFTSTLATVLLRVSPTIRNTITSTKRCWSRPRNGTTRLINLFNTSTVRLPKMLQKHNRPSRSLLTPKRRRRRRTVQLVRRRTIFLRSRSIRGDVQNYWRPWMRSQNFSHFQSWISAPMRTLLSFWCSWRSTWNSLKSKSISPFLLEIL